MATLKEQFGSVLEDTTQSNTLRQQFGADIGLQPTLKDKFGLSRNLLSGVSQISDKFNTGITQTEAGIGRPVVQQQPTAPIQMPILEQPIQDTRFEARVAPVDETKGFGDPTAPTITKKSNLELLENAILDPKPQETTQRVLEAIDEFTGKPPKKDRDPNIPLTPAEKTFSQYPKLIKGVSQINRLLLRAGVGITQFIPNLTESLITASKGEDLDIETVRSDNLNAFLDKLPASAQLKVIFDESVGLIKMETDAPGQAEFVIGEVLPELTASIVKAPLSQFNKQLAQALGETPEEYRKRTGEKFIDEPESFAFGLAIGRAITKKVIGKPKPKTLKKQLKETQPKTFEKTEVFEPIPKRPGAIGEVKPIPEVAESKQVTPLLKPEVVKSKRVKLKPKKPTTQVSPTEKLPKPEKLSILKKEEKPKVSVGVEKKLSEVTTIPEVKPTKQPWKMTIGEFLQNKGYRGEKNTLVGIKYRGNWSHQKMRNNKVWHENIVRSAFSEGKPVPPKVLKDYPDLTKLKLPDGKAKVPTAISQKPLVESSKQVKPAIKPTIKIQPPKKIVKPPPIKPKPPTERLQEIPVKDVVQLNKRVNRAFVQEFNRNQLDPIKREQFTKSVEKATQEKTSETAIDLGKELQKNPRAITREEHIGMVQKKTQLEGKIREFFELEEELLDKGDRGAAADIRGKREVAIQNIEDIVRGNDKAGTELARDFNIRNIGIDPVTHDVVGTIRRVTAAKQRPLTPKQETKFKELGKRDEALTKEVNRLTKLHEENVIRIDRLEAEKKTKRISQKEQLRTKTQKSIDKIREVRKSDIKKLNEIGFRTSAGIDPQAAFLIGRIAVSYMKEGAVTLKEVVKKVLIDLPDLTESDVIRSINVKDTKLQRKQRSRAATSVTRLKTQARLITALEDAAKGIFEPVKKRVIQPEEIRSLQQKLRKLRNNAFSAGHEKIRLEKLIQRAADLENQLANFYRTIKTDKKQPTPEAIKDVQQKIRNLRREIKVEDDIASLKEQLETNEFIIREPKPIIDKSLSLQKKEVELIRLRKKKRQEIYKLEPLTTLKVAREISNTLLTFKATLDVSGIGRQGAILVTANPDIGSRAIGKGFKALVSEFNAELFEKNLREAPTQYLRDRAKLELTEIGGKLLAGEEHFMSNFIDKIPAYRQLVRASERNMTTVLNQLRAETFDRFLSRYPDASDATMRAWADFINKASGRGNLGKFNRAGALLSFGFFAPRFAVSRIQTPLTLFKDFKDPIARRAKARALASFGATAMTALALADLGGAEVSHDPRTSDFGKIRVGNTRYDLFAGIQQPTRLLLRILIAQSDRAGLTGKELTDIEKEFDVIGELGRFAEYKQSAGISVATQILTGKDIFGEEVTPSEIALNAITPIIIESIAEAYKEEGIASALGVGTSEFFGVGASTYPQSFNATRKKIRKLQTEGNIVEANRVKDEWNINNPDRRIATVKNVDQSNFDSRLNKVKKLFIKGEDGKGRKKLKQLEKDFPDFKDQTPTEEDIKKENREKVFKGRLKDLVASFELGIDVRDKIINLKREFPGIEFRERIPNIAELKQQQLKRKERKLKKGKR